MSTVTSTSPAQGSGLRKTRLVLQMDRTDFTTYSTIRFRIWVETSNNESWSISFTTYGGWSSSGNKASSISHSGGYGWKTSNRTLIYDKSENYTRNYGVTGEAVGSISLTGIGAGQSPISHNISHGIPARVFETPSNPAGIYRERNRDTQHTITWTATASTARPIDNFRIQRHDGMRDPEWRTVATPSGSSRSWTDTGTQSNTRYQWRIRAENSSGVSSWVTSAHISTTPPGALTPSVTHQGGDNLVTVGRGGANMNVRSIIQHRTAAPGGGAWSGWSTIHTTGSIGGKNSTTTWRHENVDNSVRHQYRNRLENITDSPTLQGAWSSASNIIELLAAPNAPTNVEPNGVTLADDEAFQVRWTHNPVDSTTQTQRQVRSRILPSGSYVVYDLVTDSNMATLPATQLQGGSYSIIEVRTRGEHPDWSPWSATSTVYASARPKATITSPTEGQVLTGSSVEATWEYYDTEATPQAQWQATLYDGFDNALEFRNGAGQTFAVAFAKQLEDATTYKVGISVRDGDRLWSEETITTFSTDFALPPAPTFTAQFSPESGAVVLDISVPAPAGEQVAADHVQIWRAIGTGRELLIGDNIEPGSTFTDYLPHLVETNYYRVVAVSALPSVATSSEMVVQVLEEQREGWVYFNGGTGFQRIVRVRADAQVQVTQGRSKALREFAGRKDPVEFAGEHRKWEGSLQVKLAPSEPGHATRTDMAAIVDLPAPICYRDITAPDGHRVFVSLGEFGHGQTGVVSDGTINFTRVEDPEVKHTDMELATGQVPGAPGGGDEE